MQCRPGSRRREGTGEEPYTRLQGKVERVLGTQSKKWNLRKMGGEGGVAKRIETGWSEK